MSPEVAEGKPYGVSVDVYGWAICAHEIFHLRGKPFHGLSVSQHTERVVRNGARPVIPRRGTTGSSSSSLRVGDGR